MQEMIEIIKMVKKTGNGLGIIRMDRKKVKKLTRMGKEMDCLLNGIRLDR